MKMIIIDIYFKKTIINHPGQLGFFHRIFIQIEDNKKKTVYFSRNKQSEKTIKLRMSFFRE